MFRSMKSNHIWVGPALIITLIATAQSQPEREALSVQGYRGQANVIRYQGHVFVDAEELARITNGSLSLEKDGIILTLPGPEGVPSSEEAYRSSFSRPFIKAAIEATASIREWGGMLQVIVQNGYPVAKNAAGSTIAGYQGHAADSIAVASTAASTDSDRRGLELLRNELNNVQAWSEAFVRARSSMSAVDLTTAEDPLRDNEDAQKLVHCGQFLAQMFASGTFQDDAACH